MFDLTAEYAELASTEALNWGMLEGKTVFITGVTGLIGSCCARLLLERNRGYGADIDVVALVRDEEKAESMFRGYGEGDGLSFVAGDLLDFDWHGLKCDYLIHAACPTASKYFVEHPVETFASIVDGTRSMLEFARAVDAESFVYVSSMEIYGEGNSRPGLGGKIAESEVGGHMNPLNLRSSYPEGKRAAELCTSAYVREYGVRAKVARLAQTFGPGIPMNDTRVFAQFARCAIEGEDIVLKTTGGSTRMYNYTTDAVLAIFTILLCGEDGAAYNIANEATYSSILEMAELVAGLNDSVSVRVEVDPNAPYPPEHHLPLDTGALKGIGWEPKVGLPEMYQKLIEYLR